MHFIKLIMYAILFILQCFNYLIINFIITYFYMDNLRITLDFENVLFYLRPIRFF